MDNDKGHLCREHRAQTSWLALVSGRTRLGVFISPGTVVKDSALLGPRSCVLRTQGTKSHALACLPLPLQLLQQPGPARLPALWLQDFTPPGAVWIIHEGCLAVAMEANWLRCF